MPSTHPSASRSSSPRSSSAPTRDQTDVVGARIAAQVVDVIAMTVQLIVGGVLFAGLLGIGGRGGVALASMAATDRRQRVFDQIAATVVVRG